MYVLFAFVVRVFRDAATSHMSATSPFHVRHEGHDLISCFETCDIIAIPWVYKCPVQVKRSDGCTWSCTLTLASHIQLTHIAAQFII